MKKGKILWMAVIAALVLVPTMGWAQAKSSITTTGLPATEPSFLVEVYAGGGAASSGTKFFRDLRPGLTQHSLTPSHVPLHLFSGRLEIWLLVYTLRDLWHDVAAGLDEVFRLLHRFQLPEIKLLAIRPALEHANF